MFTHSADQVYRDFVTDNVMASGKWNPRKSDIRAMMAERDAVIEAFTSNGGLIYTSKAQMDGDLAHDVKASAWVMGDATAASNGIYQKQGASGAGSWTRVGDLPYSYIKASNAGAGTANAIVATSSIPIPAADGAALINVNITANNTGPATVAFNGGAALAIKTNSGNDVVAGGLVAGMIVAGFVSGSTFRLLSDQVSAAIQAAAEAAAASAATDADRAESARDAAQAAMSSVVPNIFATKAAAEAYTPAVAPDFLRTAGYSAAGDGGGALYKKVAVEPTHAGKFSITLADAVTVMWYEIAETVIDLRMFGVVPGAVGDQAALVQAAFSVPAREIYIPINPILADGGKIRCDSTITRNTHVKITGPGTIDFSQGASGQLLIEGSVTPLSAMSATMTKHSKTIQFSSDQGLTPGDIIILYNPTDYSFGGRRDVYRDGGMFKMHSLSGFNALVYELAVDAYNSASVQVGKLNGVRVVIDGPRFIPCSVTEAAPVCIRFGSDVVIRDAKSLPGGNYGGIQVDRCYNVVFDFTTPENNSPVAGNEYGIILSSCQHVKVQGAGAFATRHGVTIGTNGQEWSVPCRYVAIEGMSIWNQPASGIAAADIHGNGDFITYTNCVMSGFSGGGRNIRLHGCTVFGIRDLTSGMCVTMPETNGGYIEFIDCNFISEGDGSQAGAHAYIFVQGLGPNWDGLDANAFVRENIHLRVLNCRIVSPNAISTAKAVRFEGTNCNVKINITIDGLEWVAPQGLAFLYARDGTLAALPSDYLIVDNVFGPSGAYLVYPEGDVAAVPTREMAQRGKVLHTTTAAALNAAAPQNFRYKYSRMPSAHISVSDDTGANMGQVAGKSACPVVYNLSSTSIRPAIQSADNAAFAAGTDILMHWTAGVGDV